MSLAFSRFMVRGIGSLQSAEGWFGNTARWSVATGKGWEIDFFGLVADAWSLTKQKIEVAGEDQ